MAENQIFGFHIYARQYVLINCDITYTRKLDRIAILFMSKHEEPLQELLDTFGEVFPFKIKRGIELQFLNFRIIQSEHGISIDN